MMESMANEVMKTHLPSYADFDSLTSTILLQYPWYFPGWW